MFCYSHIKKKKSNCKVLDILVFLSENIIDFEGLTPDLTFAADASDIRLSSKCLECSFPLGIALLSVIRCKAKMHRYRQARYYVK